jgi:hypothetical protein
VAPTLPDDTTDLALFEVFVPAAATDSDFFQVIRRVWRRAVYPGSTMHGVIHACSPLMNAVDETTTSAGVNFGTPKICKVIIDGELITFLGGQAGGAYPMVVQDAANNPFGSAAPATRDRPYYFYAVGGRHLTDGVLASVAQRANGGSPATKQPVIIVESLVTPDAQDHSRPSANLTLPDGSLVREGAVYLGIGFTAMNTMNRKAVSWAGDWVYPMTGRMVNDSTGPAAAYLCGFNETTARVLAATITAHNIATKPSPSTMALIRVQFKDSSGSANVRVNFGRQIGIDIQADGYMVKEAAATTVYKSIDFLTNIAGGTIAADGLAEFATSTCRIFAAGYNMRVPRFSE